jgi:chromosomal replication initiation ATPase DnaA
MRRAALYERYELNKARRTEVKLQRVLRVIEIYRRLAHLEQVGDISVALSRIEVLKADEARADEIRNFLAATNGLTVLDLDSQCRNRFVTSVRQAAVYQIVEETRLSYPRIGKMFGGRDHTTVIVSIRAHHKRIGKADRGIPMPRGLLPKPSKPTPTD